MVVGAHLHAPLVLADRARRRFVDGFILGTVEGGKVLAFVQPVGEITAIRIHLGSPQVPCTAGSGATW